MSKHRTGIAASGHPETSQAAIDVMQAGGNAFDGVLAALCAACVAEPLLASLGGGGFLLAYPHQADPRVYDFFTQTPGYRPEWKADVSGQSVDFYPITADFGSTTQEFHIGMGSIAVPGVIAGLFEVHKHHGRLPMAEIMQPAIQLAEQGIQLNQFQDYINRILTPILEASKAKNDMNHWPLGNKGDHVRHPDLAQAFRALAAEGSKVFYQGDWGQQLARDCAETGGLISIEDLAAYQVKIRKPLSLLYQGAKIAMNCPPSSGGRLIATALKDLQQQWGSEVPGWGSFEYLYGLSSAMQMANQAREQITDKDLDDDDTTSGCSRGTTHISVCDGEGNLASLTLSNGEGSAYVLPGTGIMMNNMLGEEDLNPKGFHQWPANRRMASMMTPTMIAQPDGSLFALGSGGSNRIRSAILQVLVNLVEYKQSLEAAVAASRIHLEPDLLSLEQGFPATAMDTLAASFPEQHRWEENNLFFGGVHGVCRHADGRLSGAADPRRGGAVASF